MTSRGSLLPFSRSPDRSTVQDVAHAALQSRSVDVIRLDGTLFHTYQLRTSPTFFYLLRVRPPPPPHLLRHEASGLDDEAAALQILGGRPDLRTPRLIAHCPRHKPLGSPYLITGPFPGTVLSHIEPSLSATALASIDHSLGRHVRRLAEVPGPLFGPVGPRSSSPARGPVASSSWAHTFASLLDTLLHDATSTAIDAPAVPVLPDDLGALVRQHRPALDAVVHPVLLLLQSGPDSNVVVDERDMSVVGLLDYSTAIWVTSPSSSLSRVSCLTGALRCPS